MTSVVESRPTGYLIPVGEADRKRLDALGDIFNPISMKWFTSNCAPKSAQILDVGCGNGGLTRLFAQTFHDSGILGVDLSPEQVDLSKKAAEEAKLNKTTWQVADVLHLEDLRVKHPGLFDIVHVRFVLSHLPEPHKAVDQMLSLVKPGGVLIVEELGERFKFDFNKTMPKAMVAWKRMVELQHQMQQSHRDTVERVLTHLSKTDQVASQSSELFNVTIEGAAKKSMFRMGAEQGLKKMKEMGKPELIKMFGYDEGEVWIKEMNEFVHDDSYVVTAANYECIVARKK